MAQAGRALHQLQVVDDDQAQALLALEAARPGAQRPDGQRRGVVDEQRQGIEGTAGLEDLVELVVPDLAAAHGVRADLGCLGDDPRRQLLGRHLEREERDHFRGLDLGAVWAGHLAARHGC